MFLLEMQESTLILYAPHMADDILARLKRSPVLCDGAMGTLLYAKGIFINRCYDELNLSQPELIRGVHHDYLQAGAEIVETNTFGGNSFRLGRHSPAGRGAGNNSGGGPVASRLLKPTLSAGTAFAWRGTVWRIACAKSIWRALMWLGKRPRVSTPGWP